MKEYQIINVSILIIAILNYYLYLNFLVLDKAIYIYAIIVGTSISIVLYLFLKLKINLLLQLLILVNGSVYLLYFSFLLLNKEKYVSENVTVSIKGFNMRRIDAVSFSYGNKNYKRPIKSFVEEKDELNIIDNYKLKLRIRKCSKDIYYLEKMEIIQKR